MKFCAFLILVFLSDFVLAACPKHEFTDPGQIHLSGDSVMIVTHATSVHDARLSTKRGIDEAVRFAKSEHIPVIYLEDESPEEFYFMGDCNPDYWVFSESGEVSFDVQPSHLYVVGGHLELCLSRTVHDVLFNWAKHPKRDLTMTYLMDAIYSNGMSISESDPFYADFQKFMGVVTYGRPGGEHWPKLTLLETMGIIQREEHELEYLKNILPHYERTLSGDYRVELKMNDSVVKILQPAPGWHPPTLRFNFVDSAINLSQ